MSSCEFRFQIKEQVCGEVSRYTTPLGRLGKLGLEPGTVPLGYKRHFTLGVECPGRIFLHGDSRRDNMDSALLYFGLETRLVLTGEDV